MDLLRDYAIIILPLIAGFITQAVKLATDQIKGNFTWHDIVTAYGGMPSSHSAFVISVATIVGLVDGFTNPVFGVALVLSFIVIRDAMGYRMIISDQNKILNRLIQLLPENEQGDFPPFQERIGHTLPQIVVGSLIGLISALIYYWLVF